MFFSYHSPLGLDLCIYEYPSFGKEWQNQISAFKKLLQLIFRKLSYFEEDFGF